MLFADDEPVQIYDGNLPRDLVTGTDLETTRLITEGTYQLLAQIGPPPDRCSEELTARMATARDSELLRFRPNVPAMSVVRITRDKEGRVLQPLRMVAAADRNVFVYDDLSIQAPWRPHSNAKAG